ncbi:Detected protein of unknown function [Hibiscus syriacus]|uniref:RIN4 pathogenic type III effector avirulence factor Avr cleavage site domain-containing protein n=1 Tax=Hibiscus syriacus TaxID=106335 RepID=A0A6A2XGP8_HIBSY|nr:Detected protein of unknown function [Hibiscus syriacus]
MSIKLDKQATATALPVPKFGDWEAEENVPYTVYFDKARQGHAGANKPGVDEPVGQGPARRVHERRRSREEGYLRQYADSPTRHDNVNRRASGDTTPSRYGRGARGTGRGSMASPAWEGKTSYDSSYGTPGRSRLRPNTRDDESPDKSAAVPKFGDWDEVPGMSGDQSPTTMLGVGSQLTAMLLRVAASMVQEMMDVKNLWICCELCGMDKHVCLFRFLCHFGT